MSKTISPTTGKSYGLQRVCEVWSFARSNAYEQRRRSRFSIPLEKRGPKPAVSDDALLQAIKEDIEQSPFQGEGHRKIHARLRMRKELVVGRQRVLKVMRQNCLLSPYRSAQSKVKSHDGRIITDAPNIMWATDGAKIQTVDDGWVWFFGIIEHWNAECLGWQVVKKGDRFAALDALHAGVRTIYGSIDKDVARGLELRLDHGSQYTSDYFLQQTRYLGIAPSFGFVREPETNGVVERFHRTFKEQIIHGRVYRNIEELRTEVDKFIATYNEYWLLEKLGYRSPKEARQARRVTRAA